ncbi:MAG: hypothetical protein AUJ85_03640 [Elusimicrobia bacterium CG1_02_37_114]|nr:MAG: hypothetical protein AUJ85_03640 [Elusimicrobia bacterium CG1_02_37_114]PIV54145.1 MAG: hypothetical protein COS17_00155 [Elusimicrobia bacterium CG02_land_8_20_14_3_00_37_13]
MKRPWEIFGYPINNVSPQAKTSRANYNCPYLNMKCKKQSRMINYPLGICSVQYGKDIIAICPERFLQSKIVFVDISKEIFGTTDNILLFSEVRLNNIGSFDFVLVKHKPLSSDIEDFCIVEFQTDSTTGTGELVTAMSDFMKNNLKDDSYNFGMNTYNTIKLSYIQMLIKGQAMENWGKNIIWVMQSYVFENMKKRFILKNLKYKTSNFNKFFIYDLARRENIYTMKLCKKYSTTVSNLLKAFKHQPIPDLNEFLKVLKEKINLKIGLKIK